MTDERRPGPVRYRVRAYEDNYELLPDRNHLTVLDLDSPHGFRRAEVELEALRLSISVLADVAENCLPLVRLTVHSHPDGEYVMDWTAR